MAEQKKLVPPHLLLDYRGVIRTSVKYDDKEINGTQSVGYINIPETPIEPLVLVQAVDNGGKPNGAAWVWVQESDHGRGSWATYDEKLHEVPQSVQPLVDAGTDSDAELLELEEDEVESSLDYAPASEIPPYVPEEYEADSEDEVTTD